MCGRHFWCNRYCIQSRSCGIAVNIKDVTKDFVKSSWESQFVLSGGGPLEELSFHTGGSNRKVMVTADTRGHRECDGGSGGLK